MGLIIAWDRQAVVDLDQKADIKVFMARIVSAGMYRVNINIEYGITHQSDPFKSNAGFFRSLLQYHAYHIGIAIGMTARLQPEAQFAVMQHQDMGTVGIQYPRGA